MPGFRVSHRLEKMGLHTAPTGELIFEACFVPEKSRLGPVGAGVIIFNGSMEWERSFIFASHIGAVERRLEETISFKPER